MSSCRRPTDPQAKDPRGKKLLLPSFFLSSVFRRSDRRSPD